MTVVLLAACGGSAKTVPVSQLPKLVLQPPDLHGPFTAFDVGRQTRLDRVPGPRSDPTRFGRKGRLEGALEPAYAFRAGLFAGDYNGNATGAKDPTGDTGDERTAAFFTDARNGRGSGDPTSTQPGRNPICEQSDVFFDTYSSQFGGNGSRGNSQDSNVVLIAPCPTDIKDHRQRW